MDASELMLTLVPARDDPPFTSDRYQAELRQFERSLLALGVEASPIIELREAWTPVPITPPYLGDFIIKAISVAGPPIATLATAVVAWLHGRYGRKVRLRVGDIEAEAQTMEEVERLIQRAQEIQRGNQPKMIHER